MAPLNVPPTFREPLVLIARLEPRVLERLVAALAECSPFKPRADLERLVARELDSAASADDVVLVLYSLVSQARSYGEEPPAIAERAAQSSDLEIDEEARLELAKRLTTLLSLDSVVTSAKAFDIGSDHEHVFVGSRTLTDLRPVYGEDAATPPAGAAFSTTLRLDHYTDGRVHSLYLALDRSDLSKLAGDVARAQEKLEGLARLAAKAEIGLAEQDGGK